MYAPVAAASLAVVLGMAACVAAIPATSPTPTPRIESAVAAPSVSGTTAAAPSSRLLPSVAPTLSQGAFRPSEPLDLEFAVVEQVWLEPMLKFASDGRSVIFSSGVADGPDGEFAPDLWRYTPGEASPELLWRNPRRDRSLVLIAGATAGGEDGVWVFVDMPLDGSRDWNLWLLTEPGGDARLLDTHPGDEEVPGLVPSFDVSVDAWSEVAWTAFDAGPDGPVSQLLYARSPEWEPQVLEERPADKAELWFPSLGGLLAYTEVVYSADRLSDERYLYLTNPAPAAERLRLDRTGRAVMPVVVNHGVIWKQADAGFSMFNWGKLFFYDLDTERISRLSMQPQTYVDRPSAGERFVAAWGADTSIFSVHDLDRGHSRMVAQYDPLASESILAPHVEGSLLVWLYSTVDDSPIPGETQLRYTRLPPAGGDRLLP